MGKKINEWNGWVLWDARSKSSIPRGHDWSSRLKLGQTLPGNAPAPSSNKHTATVLICEAAVYYPSIQ